jgi:vancomycin resistance protein YoaR
MGGNYNPRTQSVKDAMLAELIVTELSKFTASHQQIMESSEKILSRYNDVGLVIDRMDKRDLMLAQSLKDLQLSTEQYRHLTQLSMSLSREVKEIDRHGIKIEPGALEKVIKAVEQGNKPLRKQLRWIIYGMLIAYVSLLLMILL